MSYSNFSKQPTRSAYIKSFYYNNIEKLWNIKTVNNIQIIEPISSNISLYIPGNIYLDGTIITPSDARLKQNIIDISNETSEQLYNLKPVTFQFNSDISNKLHYGFIAQDIENYFPELIFNKKDKHNNTIKHINYMEFVPLLVHQIQQLHYKILQLENQIQQLHI